jgi:hypothetical protein
VTRTAIRTSYAGTWFRSRLEARWAAFFDGIGWPWEYEPFDWDGYIPDFLVLGANAFVVEVKPESSPQELESTLAKAARAYKGIDPGRRLLDILAVGVTPLLGPGEMGIAAGSMLQWIEPDSDDDDVVNGFSPRVAEAGWYRCGKADCGQIGVVHTLGSWRGYPCGHYDGNGYLGDLPRDELERRWARARNLTQWQQR